MHLNTFLPFRIARLAAKTSAPISQIYGERHGLSRDEWRVLAAAGQADVQPTRAVAEQTGLDKVAISRAASGLEDRGLILRSEDRRDRRIKILRLSEDGARVLAEIEAEVRAREDFLLEALSATERTAFETALEKLSDRADALARKTTAELDCAAASSAGGRKEARGRHAGTARGPEVGPSLALVTGK